MARPLFEQYKDALRRGHLAVVERQLDTALEAYEEAASLVPERPLPHASMATVLHALGRREESLAALETALRLGPNDEGALRARDAIHAETSRDPRPARGTAPDPQPVLAPAPEVIATLEAELAAAPAPEPEPEPEPVAAARGEPEADLDRPLVSLDLDGASSISATGWRQEPEAREPGAEWPAIDLPSLPPPPFVGPPPDPLVLQAQADALLDEGNPLGARDMLLTAVAVYEELAQFDAALDACLQLLAIAPGDPRVHLAIAGLQLDHGWRPIATEKIDLLIRLTSLTGDTQAEADVRLLAADRLQDVTA